MIAAGIAQGLGVGDNAVDGDDPWLAGSTRLGVAMGGEPATFAGLAGVGDMITTCISPHSRNRHVGEQLGKGRTLDEILAEMKMVAEGVKTASTVRQLAQREGVAMPVCDEIYQIVNGLTSPDRAYRGLRRPGHELAPGCPRPPPRHARTGGAGRTSVLTTCCCPERRRFKPGPTVRITVGSTPDGTARHLPVRWH